jgi:hypothetical protein
MSGQASKRLASLFIFKLRKFMIETETKPNLATQWKEQLAVCAARNAEERKAEPTAAITLAGFTFVGRRLPLQKWIRSGRLPQGILAQILDDQTSADGITPELPPDEVIAAVRFQRDAVCYCVVEPKIVTHGQPGDDEISYQALCEASPELIDELIGWALAGAPGVPVATTEGEVSVDALKNFQQKRPGGVPVRVGADGEQVSSEAESGAGAAG